MKTTVLDALHIAQFSVNEKFGTAVKDLVEHALNEVLTNNPKLTGLEDGVETLVVTDEAVAKIRNSTLVTIPLMNSIAAQVCRIVDLEMNDKDMDAVVVQAWRDQA